MIYAPLVVTRPGINHNANRITQPHMGVKKISRRRYIVSILFALSCVPYAMPVEQRPPVYTDGLTSEQIMERQQNRRIAKFLYS